MLRKTKYKVQRESVQRVSGQRGKVQSNATLQISKETTFMCMLLHLKYNHICIGTNKYHQIFYTTEDNGFGLVIILSLK